MQKIMNELEKTMKVLDVILETKASMIAEELINDNNSLSETMNVLYIETHSTTTQYIEFYNIFLKEEREEEFTSEENELFKETLYSRIRLLLNEKAAQYLINGMKKLS